MAERVGTLAVELDLDGTNFVRNMAKVRSELSGAKNEFRGAARDVEWFAKRGLGEIAPGAEHAAEALFRLGKSWQSLIGLFAAGHPILRGLAIGLGLVAGSLGFHKGLSALADKLSGMADVRKDIESERAGLVDRELRVFNENVRKRLTAEAEAVEKLKELRDKEFTDYVQSQQKQTEFLMTSLRERLQARQAFVESIGLAGGGAASGFRAVRELRGKATQRTREIAFLQGEGQLSDRDAFNEFEQLRAELVAGAQEIREQFAGVPAVLDMVDRSLDPLAWSRYREEIEQARPAIQAHVDIARTLTPEMAQLSGAVSVVTTAMGAGSEATNQLTHQVFGLRQQVVAATHEINALSAAASSRAAAGPRDTLTAGPTNTGIQEVE